MSLLLLSGTSRTSGQVTRGQGGGKAVKGTLGRPVLPRPSHLASLLRQETLISVPDLSCFTYGIK